MTSPRLLNGIQPRASPVPLTTPRTSESWSHGTRQHASKIPSTTRNPAADSKQIPWLATCFGDGHWIVEARGSQDWPSSLRVKLLIVLLIISTSGGCRMRRGSQEVFGPGPDGQVVLRPTACGK